MGERKSLRSKNLKEDQLGFCVIDLKNKPEKNIFPFLYFNYKNSKLSPELFKLIKPVPRLEVIQGLIHYANRDPELGFAS